jgi:peptide/nickel transport system permease protein
MTDVDRTISGRSAAIGQAWRVLARNPVSVVALCLVPALAAVAIAAPWITPFDPNATDLDHVLQGPSSLYWFGTDQVGRDVFSRVLIATRLDLSIAVSAVLLSSVVGTAIGGAAALYGGYADRFVGRLTDVLMTFPLFVVAMALVAALGNSVQSIVLASAVVNLPFFVRLARSEVSVLRAQQYVEAARAGGNTELQVLFGFMIPNALPTLTVQVSTALGWAVLNAASLSFIGLGIRPPTAEWGIMVAEGAANILSGFWWLAIFPAAALTFTVLCFNLLGDGLRDVIDVRTRR